MAELTENKANSANPAELELGLSWVELGNNHIKPLPLVVGKLALGSVVKYFPTMKLVSSLGFPRMRAAR